MYKVYLDLYLHKVHLNEHWSVCLLGVWLNVKFQNSQQTFSLMDHRKSLSQISHIILLQKKFLIAVQNMKFANGDILIVATHLQPRDNQY